MNQISIISDLIKWIESNLEQSLSIDNVAQKSGYSKWHLQRMFKKTTGQVLGTYIRHRRLTYTALTLKITSKPILDIAMQYQFDSQQTFTRSFKKQFNMTPAHYRRNPHWDPSGLTPPIELSENNQPLPNPIFIELPRQVFWGITYKNQFSFKELLQRNAILRKEFFLNYHHNYLNNKGVFPDKFYGLWDIKKNKKNSDEQEIFYTIGLQANSIEDAKQYINEGGHYVCFQYKGSPKKFEEFISKIYLNVLPKLGVKIRDSNIVEIHHNNHQINCVEDIENIKQIECDYCIPIIRDK